ncbi:hypothetical protein GCM10027275_16380 [Rhabdobacter roseus]|uniref:Uncharacterized protein n=1 Tax=Rhabdobacter roseus TaxID=1655419 RepID=A0A840TV61_9BACT|nr:hypothetical protein [Rhabdobacter roseus]MBB5283559.1 hypothetical protein [Rhabdobacter roseus]
MKKKNIFQTKNLLYGFVPIHVLNQMNVLTIHLRNGDMAGTILGLISIILGTQRQESQKPPYLASAQADKKAGHRQR